MNNPQCYIIHTSKLTKSHLEHMSDAYDTYLSALIDINFLLYDKESSIFFWSVRTELNSKHYKLFDTYEEFIEAVNEHYLNQLIGIDHE